MTRPKLASWFKHGYCAAGAARLLADLEARYPALIEAEKINAESAARDLSLARALVAQ